MNRTVVFVGGIAVVLSLLMIADPWGWGDASLKVDFPYGVKYEVFVQSYADSDDDGIGDIAGLAGKLDYIESLGVNGIWLMPIMPSPSYHKYDVTDYYNIHPDYGTLADFKHFVQEAHQRGIRIIIDMVINHTSTQHPWFVQASSGSKNKFHDYYLWEPNAALQAKANVAGVSKDAGELKRWYRISGNRKKDSLKNSRYYGFFNEEMPDLNFNNERVKKEVIDIARFWLQDMKVDGFRLDAARHIFPEDRVYDNYQFLDWYRSELVKIKPDVYLVGEVQENAQRVLPYVQGLPSMFNFDLSKAIMNAVKSGVDSARMIRNYVEVQHFYKTSNPNFIDALFLTNHDQNRVRSVLGRDTAKAKLAAAILLSLPGIPFVYYGEEIGMLGKKPDKYIREPFLWGTNGSMQEQTTWISPIYSNASSVATLFAQQKDANSIWHTYKRLIEIRNATPAITYGELADYPTNNPSLLAWECTADEGSVLVVHNLSSEPQSMNIFFKEGISYKKLYVSSSHIEMQGGTLTLSPLASTIINMEARD